MFNNSNLTLSLNLSRIGRGKKQQHTFLSLPSSCRKGEKIRYLAFDVLALAVHGIGGTLFLLEFYIYGPFHTIFYPVCIPQESLSSRCRDTYIWSIGSIYTDEKHLRQYIHQINFRKESKLLWTCICSPCFRRFLNWKNFILEVGSECQLINS